MQKILRKRVLRDLRENLLRYLALALLIILGMYIVISLVGAADTVIERTAELAKVNQMEDGEFRVFVPLKKSEITGLKEKGILLEEMCYLDFLQEDESTLRVFKNREEINLIALDEGRLAENPGELVIEKRYSEEKGIMTGDYIEIGGISYEVIGIGTVPDYEAPYKNLSDSSVDSKNFGVAFVSADAYRKLKESGTSVKSEELVYAYRLNGAMTDDELKDELMDLTVSAEDVEDVYFQKYWEETGGKREELEDGIQELVDGSKELYDGAKEISDGVEAIKSGAVLLAGGNSELYNGSKELYDGSVELYDGSVELCDGSAELYDGMKELKDSTDELMDEYFEVELSNLTQFLTAEDNPRIGASAADQIVNKEAGLVAGVIVIILFTYVISVFVIHGIEQESSIIGTLYALGVKRKELIRHYLMLPVIVTMVAGIIGTALGYSSWGVEVQMGDNYKYFSTPVLETVYQPYLLIYGIVMPPVIAAVVNYFVIRRRLTQPALRLIRGEKKSSKVSKVKLGNMGFIGRFRIRQMLREVRSAFTVCFGMFVSLLILMMGMDCYMLCEHISVENKEDTKYEYMYTYKYPQEEVPKGGEACYAKTMKKEIFGYNLDITVLGIDEENPYFTAKPKEGMSKVIVSSAMAQKYGLSVEDKLILTDEEEERDYAFTVEEITQYSPGMYVFMDIDSMRELFGQKDDYYNVVLSEKELDIESGMLYAVTTKQEIAKSSDVFVSMMGPMVTMLTVLSVLIFAVVMYLMMKVMIDRSAFSISLMKIFGYRTGEIRKLYLNGNFYMIALGAAICLPLAKWMMDAMYPVLISNIACGMNLSFTWQMYALIYLGIIGLYFIINQMLVGRLKKMIPAEVLKNRE